MGGKQRIDKLVSDFNKLRLIQSSFEDENLMKELFLRSPNEKDRSLLIQSTFSKIDERLRAYIQAHYSELAEALN
jgi:hypothetical protein